MTQRKTPVVSAQAIDAVLPQTQCGECDYAGCLPYAEAIVTKGENIDRCPPGGVETLNALAQLTGIDATPYQDTVTEQTRKPSVASIREAECIGCTKCIQACPVDAIIGSAKLMHTVITQECTGCGLCVEPCPVDCIDLHTLTEPQYDKAIARKRFQFHQFRMQRDQQERLKKHATNRKIATVHVPDQERQAKQNYIQAALERVKQKKSHTQ